MKPLLWHPTNMDGTDVTVRVPRATTGAGGSTEETLFRCHKFILAARSDFFKGCFSHNFKETVTSVVDLPDAPVSAVETLLKFIYTDEVSQDEVDVDL